MKTNIKKLHLNMTFKEKATLFTYILTKKLETKLRHKLIEMHLKKRKHLHGLKIHDLKLLPNGNAELLIEGEKSHLWDVVKWSQNAVPVSEIHEIHFRFIEA